MSEITISIVDNSNKTTPIVIDASIAVVCYQKSKPDEVRGGTGHLLEGYSSPIGLAALINHIEFLALPHLKQKLKDHMLSLVSEVGGSEDVAESLVKDLLEQNIPHERSETIGNT